MSQKKTTKKKPAKPAEQPSEVKKSGRKVCPQCGSAHVVYNRVTMELVFNACGLITHVS